MNRRFSMFAGALTLLTLLPGGARAAVTREIADLQPAQLTFRQSVLNQLTYGTYRDPFDELQTRPYNLPFENIGRHPNLTPWQGQEGSYSRYVNALIGNNGASNVDNGADALQGSGIRRQTATLAWGISAAVLAGQNSASSSNPTVGTQDDDELTGYDLRGAVGWQLGSKRVLGGGIRIIGAGDELTESSFEQGVGGFFSPTTFDQQQILGDFGVRHFFNERSSWDAQIQIGTGSFEQLQVNETLDAGGVVTDRFTFQNYQVTGTTLALSGGYNRLRRERAGETEYRVGIARTERELDNSDLSFSEAGGTVTPLSTLLAQDPITTQRVFASARTVFRAGQTEMFSGAELGYATVEGSTSVDNQGVVVVETVDDSSLGLGLTLGLRQPLFQDKLRFIVSGRADLIRDETNTVLDNGGSGREETVTAAQYAVGLEGVLANVVFDIAWISGEEAPVVPVPFGVPEGSRRVIEFDRLIVSAAVSW